MFNKEIREKLRAVKKDILAHPYGLDMTASWDTCIGGRLHRIEANEGEILDGFRIPDFLDNLIGDQGSKHPVFHLSKWPVIFAQEYYRVGGYVLTSSERYGGEIFGIPAQSRNPNYLKRAEIVAKVIDYFVDTAELSEALQEKQKHISPGISIREIDQSVQEPVAV